MSKKYEIEYRRRQIICILADSYQTQGMIAETLNVHPNTISSDFRVLYRQFGVTSVRGLAARIRELGAEERLKKCLAESRVDEHELECYLHQLTG